jgi:hypothetical protein
LLFDLVTDFDHIVTVLLQLVPVAFCGCRGCSFLQPEQPHMLRSYLLISFLLLFLVGAAQQSTELKPGQA